MPIYDGDRAGSNLARVLLFFLISRSRILVKSDFRPFSLRAFFFSGKNIVVLKRS